MYEKTELLPGGKQGLVRVAYTSWEAHGITALVVVSCLSLIAVLGLLTAITLSAINTRSLPRQQLFLRSHAAAYLISLLICDAIQSVASIMNAKWIINMAVETSSFCVAQGAMKQVSDVGLSFWTFVIALHTFCLVFLGMTPRPYVVWVTLVTGWSGIGILAMSGPTFLDTAHRGPFYGISGFWCWITPSYVIERATLDYMFMFMAGTGSFVLYTLVFLRLRGNIVASGRKVTFRKTSSNNGSQGIGKQVDSRTMSVAKKMLLYPVAYTIVILPIAAARFSDWAGNDVPFEVTMFSDVVFLLSGVVNVTLFTCTRRLLPAGSIRLPSFGTVADMRAIPRPQIPSGNRLESGLSSYSEPMGSYSGENSDDSTEKIVPPQT
ncbi:hypothetical protein C8J57DRAFT_1325285 [Mycena rebaudengoi]|nr:hypothetical protein C8J57DRAFT_1325285 [Mycena rebaudengoi]